MSRGRKPKSKNAVLDWQQFFKKNIGQYLQILFTELALVKSNQDGTGFELLKKIKAEKSKLIKEKKIPNERELPPLKLTEIPFAIPDNWVWCRLGEISINCDGARIPISQVERNGREKKYDYYGASGVIDKIDGFTHDGKFLLIGEDGANLKAKSTPIAFIAEGKFWVNNHAHVLNFIDDITLHFAEYCLNAIDINSFITGGFQPKLNQANLNLIPIPLPPLEEQYKIVNFFSDFESNDLKINRNYFNEGVEQKIISIHKSQLTGSEISAELNEQQNLLKQLCQSFLREAMQGKLTEQNSKDGNASELLEKIKKEKEKKKIEKTFPSILESEIPFTIPKNWEWCRLGEICDNITKGSSPKWQGVQYVDKSKGILYITSKNVDSFKIDLTKATYVEEKFNEIEPRSILKRGDLLTNIVGASIGRTALFDLDEIANINQAVCILRIEHSFISKQFLLYLMNADFVIQLMFKMQFAPGRANLSMGNLANFPIPFPPLAEQKRIVKKLVEVMNLCEELKTIITDNQNYTNQLLQVALKDALQMKEVETITE